MKGSALRVRRMMREMSMSRSIHQSPYSYVAAVLRAGMAAVKVVVARLVRLEAAVVPLPQTAGAAAEALVQCPCNLVV